MLYTLWQQHKKSIVIALIALIVLLAIFKILTTSFVSIKTEEGVAITVQQLTKTEYTTELKEVASGTGSLFFIGNSGDYIVTVSRFAVQQSQFKKFGPFLTNLSYSFSDIPTNHTPQPIANVDAKNIYLKNNSLQYMEAKSGVTYKINDTDAIAPQPVDELDARDITWTHDGTKGITTGLETNRLFTAKRSNSGMIEIQPIDSIGPFSGFSTAISQGGVLYVSADSAIYKSTNGGKNFTKLHTTTSDIVSMYPLGNDNLLIVDAENSKDSQTDNPSFNLVLLDAKGAIVKTKKSVAVRTIYPSPDGKHFVINDYERGVFVYDSETLSASQQLPVDGAGSLLVTWINNEELVYSNNRTVSSLSIGVDGISRTVATLPTGHTVTYITYLQESGDVYFTSVANDSMYYLNKINYKKPVDTTSYAPKLYANFPVLYGNCMLSYSNVKTLSLLYSLANDKGTDNECQQSARRYASNLDLSVKTVLPFNE